jgi:hypothetical protein
MLVVRVELWPDGDGTRARQVGLAGLANVSELADASDYVGVLTDDCGVDRAVMIRGHSRAAGFWPLLARACVTEGAEEIPDDLVHVASAVAERLDTDASSAAMTGPLHDPRRRE